MRQTDAEVFLGLRDTKIDGILDADVSGSLPICSDSGKFTPANSPGRKCPGSWPSDGPHPDHFGPGGVACRIVSGELSSNQILLGDNLELLPQLPGGSFQLVYIDPPFNTGRDQVRNSIRTVPDENGDRTGFQGRRYRTELLNSSSYRDSFDDFLGFLAPRLEEAHRLLNDTGTLYFHIDYREAHYCKLLLDEIFGREGFINEIIWAYDYGARSKKRWPAKHDTILVYVKDPKMYLFNSEEVDREPYMAPGLVTPEKVAKGKLPTDVWWHTIVPTGGQERTGYPSQKPAGIVRRMVTASTRPGDWCLDFFCGSGTLGAVAADLDRKYVLIDSNPEAIEVTRKRLAEPVAAVRKS